MDAGGARRRAGTRSKCALCAEDPAQGFLPQAGRLLACRFPHAPGLRVDAGVERGDAIPVQYDSLIAKIVAHAATRDAAIARLSAALRRTLVFGVRTNATLLARILAHPRFVAGDVDTGFVADEHDALVDARPAHPRPWPPPRGSATSAPGHGSRRIRSLPEDSRTNAQICDCLRVRGRRLRGWRG